MKLKFTASAVIAAALTLTACATSPTGRNQVLLYSETQLAQMGDQAFTGMKEELKISNKAVQNSYVECVATHLRYPVEKLVSIQACSTLQKTSINLLLSLAMK